MSNANLYQLLLSRFRDKLESPCLSSTDGRDYSYAEMHAWSASMATTLADLGALPGDRVLVQVEKCPANVALYLACLRGGYVLVPLNTAYTPAELAYFIADAEPRVIVCDSARRESIAVLVPSRCQLVSLDGSDSPLQALCEAAAQDSDTEQSICLRSPGDLAAIVYTSGTTGRSKGAMLTHANLASNALTLHELWGFREGDVLLHALPVFHVHGLFIALNTAMLNASRIIFLPKFDTREVLASLPQASVMMGVPTFYTRLLGDPGFDQRHYQHMRLFICGSAPLTEQTFHAFEARTGQRILERYGMSETGMITSNPLQGERVAGTVGFALPGVEVRISTAEGNPLPPGEVGIIEVRGPNVFPGYWKMPEKTAEDIREDGWFITGDMGRMDEHGRVSIVGRQKDLIISGGFNVYPKEVELCLDATEQIAEAAVIGVPHPDYGEAVVAICVPSAASRETSPEELREQVLNQIRQQLAGFKQPKQFLLVEELPRNAMGKVQKNTLRENYNHLFDAGF